MNAPRHPRRGLFSVGGLALLLALPGTALAQSAPATGTSQPGTAGSTTPGNAQPGTAGSTTPGNAQPGATSTTPNAPQPSTVPAPSSTSSFGMGVDAQGEGLTVPQPRADDGTGLYDGNLGTGLYGEDRTRDTLGIDLGVGGSEQPPASLVPTPSTETNGVLNGTGGSSIPGMDESAPPQIEVPQVPSSDDAMGTQDR